MKLSLFRSLRWLERTCRPFARRLPEPIKASLRRFARASQVHLQPPSGLLANDASAALAADDYAYRLRREQDIFADQVDVNELPRIFHYWSHTYLRPKLEHFGCANPDEFFAVALEAAAREAPGRAARFVSLGAGNCDTEVRVAQILVARGLRDFVLECVDINPVMLGRGAALARKNDLGERVVPILGDFNAWQPARRYDAIMANQSLHHVLRLENLFDVIAENLPPHGRFVISDMVGRNGHQRWPEALAIVREFWAELPRAYRYHQQLRRQWNEFVDFDCSSEGFEGIRAQDILPLMIERFAFERFLGFANVIDPFIDRGFGGHFDADSPHDRDLIDRIHARDEAEIIAGTIKPTHAMAVMRGPGYTGPLQVWRNLTPRHCLRVPA